MENENNKEENEGEVKASIEPRYTCSKTGAHFSFSNMCERLHKLFEARTRDNTTTTTTAHSSG